MDKDKHLGEWSGGGVVREGSGGEWSGGGVVRRSGQVGCVALYEAMNKVLLANCFVQINIITHRTTIFTHSGSYSRVSSTYPATPPPPAPPKHSCPA